MVSGILGLVNEHLAPKGQVFCSSQNTENHQAMCDPRQSVDKMDAVQLLALTVSVCAVLSVALVQAETRPPASMVLGSYFRPQPGSQQQILISRDSKVAFGFRSFSADLHYVAVWYAELDNTIVWVANRDAPASSQASLNFTSTGELVLYQENGTLLWTTDTVGQGVVSARIDDSGDFQLIDGSGALLWRSFNNPTDTLLPGQLLTKGQDLTARLNSLSIASGGYRLVFPSAGNYVDLTYTSLYARATVVKPWSPAYYGLASPTPITLLEFELSGMVSLRNETSTSKSTYVSFIPTDMSATGATRRLTLDVDGNLKTYSWNQSLRRWIVVWRSLYRSCYIVQNSCGPYGICTNRPEPVCVCPLGFDVVDTNDIYKGCTPRVPINSCSTSKYLALDNTDFLYYDLNSTTGVSTSECLKFCSDSCECLGVIYSFAGGGDCWLKTQILNGISPADYDRVAFLKVSSEMNHTVNIDGNEAIANWTSMAFWQKQSSPSIAPLPSSTAPVTLPHKSLTSMSQTAILVTTLITVAQIAFFVLIAWHLSKKKIACISVAPTPYSYKCLVKATKNFKVRLGSGEFGDVFKGKLATGEVVAVKNLKEFTVQDKHFRAEVGAMTSAHHIHLVRLYGFCAEDHHRLLVYEYMVNGSLDEYMFRHSQKRPILNWETRFNICLGTARAITYLHEDCPSGIIHCDIKPHNILVDERFSPKVSDFGLAHSFARSRSLPAVSGPRGTAGYRAPEWNSGDVSIDSKADVFSFGILLIEIVSGLRTFFYPLSGSMDRKRQSLPKWAFEEMSKGNVKNVIDSRVQPTVEELKQVENVLKVAFWCIQTHKDSRPTMRKVVQMLRGNISFENPPEPHIQVTD